MCVDEKPVEMDIDLSIYLSIYIVLMNEMSVAKGRGSWEVGKFRG